jgi:hypothetical protein
MIAPRRANDLDNFLMRDVQPMHSPRQGQPLLPNLHNYHSAAGAHQALFSKDSERHQ